MYKQRRGAVNNSARVSSESTPLRDPADCNRQRRAIVTVSFGQRSIDGGGSHAVDVAQTQIGVKLCDNQLFNATFPSLIGQYTHTMITEVGDGLS